MKTPPRIGKKFFWGVSLTVKMNQDGSYLPSEYRWGRERGINLVALQGIEPWFDG
jgi:hypothetical protein